MLHQAITPWIRWSLVQVSQEQEKSIHIITFPSSVPVARSPPVPVGQRSNQESVSLLLQHGTDSHIMHTWHVGHVIFLSTYLVHRSPYARFIQTTSFPYTIPLHFPYAHVLILNMTLSLYLLCTYRYSLISTSLVHASIYTMYFLESNPKFNLAVQSISLTRSLCPQSNLRY